MNANRKTGIIIGILFITGTVSGIVSFFLTGEITNSHEYLVKIASNDNRFILGSLFTLLMGSVSFIPIVLYPTLKKHNARLAVGYVVFRGAIETLGYIAMWVSMLFLVFVGKNFVSNGTSPLQLKNIVALVLKFHDLGSLITLFVFCIGGFLLYLALYQSKLVPVWLSVWGFIAIVLYLVTAFLLLFGLEEETSTLISFLSLPIFFQEMVMAVWLIMKGFNPGAFDKN